WTASWDYRRGRGGRRRRGPDAPRAVEAGSSKGSLPHELEELVERPRLERVVLLALAGDRGRRGRAVVMARQHDEGVVEREEPVVQAVVELGRVAARKVGPSTLPDEERVAGGDVPLEDVEDAVLGVARRVDHMEPEPPDRHGVPVGDGDVLVDRRDAVGDDLRPGALLHVLVAGDVVWVAVGVQDVSDLHAPRIDRLEHGVDAERGVDHDPLPTGFLRHEVGEVKIRPDAELVEEHAPARRGAYLRVGEVVTGHPGRVPWSGDP